MFTFKQKRSKLRVHTRQEDGDGLSQWLGLSDIDKGSGRGRFVLPDREGLHGGSSSNLPLFLVENIFGDPSRFCYPQLVDWRAGVNFRWMSTDVDS